MAKVSKKEPANLIYFFVLLDKQRGSSVLFDFREGVKKMISKLTDDGAISDAGYFFRKAEDIGTREIFDLNYDERTSLGKKFIDSEFNALDKMCMMLKVTSDYTDRKYSWFFYIRLMFPNDKDDNLIGTMQIELPELMNAQKFFTVSLLVP